MKLSADKICEVVDKDGGRHLARVYVCANCGHNAFQIFLINGRHQHVQCTECGVSYCDGSCGGISTQKAN